MDEIKYIWRESGVIYAMTEDGDIYVRSRKHGPNGSYYVWAYDMHAAIPQEHEFEDSEQ